MRSLVAASLVAVLGGCGLDDGSSASPPRHDSGPLSDGDPPRESDVGLEHVAPDAAVAAAEARAGDSGGDRTTLDATGDHVGCQSAQPVGTRGRWQDDGVHILIPYVADRAGFGNGKV